MSLKRENNEEDWNNEEEDSFENEITSIEDVEFVIKGDDDKIKLIEYPPRKILFIASNPKDLDDLDQKNESKAIEYVFLKEPGFKFTPRFNISRHELLKYLYGNEPHILHFSGHGEEGFVSLENSEGMPDSFQIKKFGDLIKAYNRNRKDRLVGVIISSCFSISEAEKISENVDFVIAMSGDISVKAANDFILGFYEMLITKHSISDAYESALSMIDEEEEEIPKLLPNKDFKRIYLF